MWNIPLLPKQASSYSGRVDAVFLYELAVLVFFTTLILVLILYFSIKYRRANVVNRSGAPTHSRTLEILWIGIPLVLSLIMFFWSAAVYYEQYEAPGDAFDVYVTGKQWMWKFKHPEGKSEINDLHVPVGRAVRLRMTSEDVIHSVYVPDFRIKQDVLPGRETTLWFRPTAPGRYHLFCAEYCGTNHSLMGGWVYVMEPADYEAWLASGTGEESMAKEGERLFVTHHCAGCHGASQAVRAPRLEGVFGKPVPVIDEGRTQPHWVTADTRYVRDSILLPKSQIVAGYEPLMPSYQGQISEDDLLKIIEYIKSIGSKEAAR